MNEVVPFVFNHDQETIPIRVENREGNPWFVNVDVCRALSIENASQALRVLDADEKGVCIIYTLGGPQELNIISEPGLYKLIQRSRKPIAKRFDRFVRHEVLPSIRRAGKYELPTGPQQPDLLQAINDVSTQMSEGFGRLEEILGNGRHRFRASQVRYVSVGLAKHNKGECWYCNDAVIVDDYSRRIDGASEVHHADGNKANTRTENCMLACTANGCHDRLTYPNRSDYIPATEAIALAFTFHQRLRQKNGQIKPPTIPKNGWEFRPWRQASLVLPPGKKRSA